MEERSLRIIQEAVGLAEKGGFDAVRLRDLAARSGVALGTVYSRFASKEAILVAALDLEVGKFEAVLADFPIAGASEIERVSFFFEAASMGLFARDGFARAVLKAVGSGDPGVAEHIIGYQDRITRLVAKAMRGAGAAFDDDEDLAFVMQQVWYAALVGWVCGARDEQQVIAHTTKVARMLLAKRPARS
jgi:TetR/AcrR family transcriptional regulator, cholesterol catabolism regulator